MTYENFVRDLDTGDAFTATMVEILVKVRACCFRGKGVKGELTEWQQEVAERRGRPQPDRRYLSQRTTSSLRKLAMPLNQYPSRVRHSHMSRRPFATMLPEYDDDDNFELMVQEAAEGTQRSSADLYDALSIPWPGRSGRTDGEESSLRTTMVPLRVRSPPSASIASGSGATTSAFPPASRSATHWSVLPPAPGTTLTRQASIRRPFTSRNIEFNNFTRRHRSAHRDGLDGEGSDIPVAEPRDEPWTTRASSATTGPYGSARRFLPGISARRLRRSEAQREAQRRAGIVSDSSSDEDLMELANAGTEQFLAYTGHPSLRAVLGGTSPPGAGPSPAGPSTFTPGAAGPSGSGESVGEIPTSDERTTETTPVSASMAVPRLRRGGLRAPESMVTPSATPPVEDPPTSTAVPPGAQIVAVEEVIVLGPSREEPVAYPTPSSIAEGEHLT
jgi:hypothetical protein